MTQNSSYNTSSILKSIFLFEGTTTLCWFFYINFGFKICTKLDEAEENTKVTNMYKIYITAKFVCPIFKLYLVIKVAIY
jgi:hypothetical protein